MKYIVRLERAIFMSAEVAVDCENEELACEIAKEHGQKQVDGEASIFSAIEWELDSDTVDVEEVDEA